MSTQNGINHDGPLVSVFMPTYNHENFIAEAIESVLCQTYKNYEIVIGDDCSTDATWDIVTQYQNKYPEKIIAFRNEKNIGITNNCNKILRRCSGKYIAFTSGDDLFLPDKLAKQVAIMESDPNVILCYHDLEVFDSTTGRTIRYYNRGDRRSAPVSGLAHRVVARVVSDGNGFLGGSSVITRRDSIPEQGYDSRVPYASDWLMWIDVLAGAHDNARVVYLPLSLARYRRHQTNITNRSELYIADPYVTLAIVEAKYPCLIPAVRNSVSYLRYMRGIQEILNGNYRIGRRLLLESLRGRLVSWKIFYWLSVSFLPNIRVLVERMLRREASD